MNGITQENVTKLVIASITHDDDLNYVISRRTLVAILDSIWGLKPEWHELLDYNPETGWLIEAYDEIELIPADEYYIRPMVEFNGKLDWNAISKEDSNFIESLAWKVRVEQSELTDYPEYKAAAYELRDKLIAANIDARIEYRAEFETDDSWDVNWRIGLCHYSVSWYDGKEIWTHKIFRGGYGIEHHTFLPGEEPDLFKMMFLDDTNDPEDVRKSYEWETKND